MKIKYKDIFIILFIISPFLACLANYFNINNSYIWYLPNLLMAIYGVSIAWEKRKVLFIRKYRLITLFFISALISCLLAQDQALAFLGSGYRLEGLLTYISYLGFFALGISFKSETKIQRYLNLYLLTALILSIIVLLNNDFSWQLSNIQANGYYFYRASFFHYNHFGYYLLIACLASFYMIISSKKHHKIPYFLMLPVLLHAFIINDTFGAYLACIIGIILLLCYFIKQRKHLLELLTIIILFITVGSVTYRNDQNIVKKNFNELYADIQKIFDNKLIAKIIVPYEVKALEKVESDDIGEIGTGRFKIWYTSFKIIKARPIFGYGFDNAFSEYAKYNLYQSRPHNLFLELLINLGLCGLILYLSILFAVFKRCALIIKGSNYISIFCVVIFISFLFNLMVGNSTFYVSPYFYLIIGMMFRENAYEIRS